MNANIRNIVFTTVIFFCSLALFAQKPDIYRLKKVVIDAGHGGKDPGAVGKNCYEKDITLKIALKLGAYIKQNFPDVEVLYTRTTDVFIELDERSAVANSHKADLFISIHVDANKNTKASGTSTYVMGLHRAEDNLEVVKRENAVVKLESDYKTAYGGFDPDSPESHIVMTLFQNAYLERSIRLATQVQKQFNDRAGRNDRGVRQAGLIVLWNCTMPGILIETGFITNAEEEKFLMSDNGQAVIASAIYRAFRDYKNELEKKTGTQPDNDTKVVVPDLKKTETGSSTVIYKVQIASSPKKLETIPQNFKGIKGVERTKVENKYRYTVGNTSDFEQITKLQTEIRGTIPDAYIIAFNIGTQIPVKQALEIQKKEKK